MLDRGQRGSPGTTIVPGDHHVIGLALGHPGSHRADADFGHQLDGNAGSRIDVLQIVNQLGQILDGVDVMVRRGRDQTHTRHRVAQLADVLGDLAARQLTTFTRLGALGHLDLDLIGRGQVFGGHAETARRHLLDLGAQGIAFAQGDIALNAIFTDHGGEGFTLLDEDAPHLIAITLGVFTTFTGIGLATDAVHCDSQRGVGFGGD